MNRSRFVAATIAGLMVVLLLGTAKATTIGECAMTIDALEAATGAAEFLGNNAAKDQQRLLAKLAEADLKLNQGKFADAVQKLGDYREKVISVVADGKLGVVDGFGEDQMADGIGDLEGGAQDAINCISRLG